MLNLGAAVASNCTHNQSIQIVIIIYGQNLLIVKRARRDRYEFTYQLTKNGWHMRPHIFI